MTAPILIGSFPQHWQAEILPARPLILPPRHYVYPAQVEEIERGALEVLIKPDARDPGAPQTPGAPSPDSGTWDSDNAQQSQNPQPFLATCALGFRDAAVPTGLWSTPKPEEICAVSGGYAYLIDTTAPEQFTMIPYRPVLEILPAPVQNLLLFVGHRFILAWGVNGKVWESERLSSEGITLAAIEGDVLRGQGWDVMTDREVPFALDMQTGLPVR